MSRSFAAGPRVVGAAAVALAIAAGGIAGGRGSVDPGPRFTAHEAGGRVVRGASYSVRGLASPINYGAAEPTLGAQSDGSIFYVGLEGDAGGEIFRSDDGRSWERVSPQLPGGHHAHQVSLDPYVYVDPATNRVFTVDLTVACSLLSFTDDDGETWTTNPLACGRPVNDHQTLFAGPPVTSSPVNYENVVYYCWNDVATSSCSKSLDGGVTFTPTGTPAFASKGPEDLSPEPYECGGLHGHGVVDRHGTVYIPKEHCGRPMLAVSTDEGMTWRQVGVAKLPAIEGPDPSVAVDSHGNIYYAWIASDGLPYLATSRDGGERWSKPMMIGAPGVRQANLPTIAAGRRGEIAFAYYGTPNPRDPLKWYGYMGVSGNALDRDPLFHSGPVTEADEPFVLGECGPGRCSVVLDFVDVVIDRRGIAWGSFVDACDYVCDRSGIQRIDGRGAGVAVRLSSPIP